MEAKPNFEGFNHCPESTSQIPVMKSVNVNTKNLCLQNFMKNLIHFFLNFGDYMILI